MSSVTEASPCGQAAHDPEPIHIGQGLVDQAYGPQVVGLVDDSGEGGPNASG